MIHYHSADVTPRQELLRLAGRHFFVSFAYAQLDEVAHRIGQTVMLDNGAYTFYQSGKQPDWDAYLDWCGRWLQHRTTWAIIPDVVGGSEQENDELLRWWDDRARHLPRWQTAPVWHVHQSTERLVALCRVYSRVCVGSSVGEYKTVGGQAWRARMNEAMNVLCGDGPPPVWLHLLRGLAMRGSEYPFASADSSIISQDHNRQVARRGYRRDVADMARVIDSVQSPAVWQVRHQDQGEFDMPEPPWGTDEAHRTAHRHLVDQLNMGDAA